MLWGSGRARPRRGRRGLKSKRHWKCFGTYSVFRVFQWQNLCFALGGWGWVRGGGEVAAQSKKIFRALWRNHEEMMEEMKEEITVCSFKNHIATRWWWKKSKNLQSAKWWAKSSLRRRREPLERELRGLREPPSHRCRSRRCPSHHRCPNRVHRPMATVRNLCRVARWVPTRINNH